ncbi:MAG: hypothetical protein JW871_00005, partial [Endomicrobiales bacterium]|nr:hypothetical protein [Endomicrobiales bacterium]
MVENSINYDFRVIGESLSAVNSVVKITGSLSTIRTLAMNLATGNAFPLDEGPGEEKNQPLKAKSNTEKICSPTGINIYFNVLPVKILSGISVPLIQNAYISVLYKYSKLLFMYLFLLALFCMLPRGDIDSILNLKLNRSGLPNSFLKGLGFFIGSVRIMMCKITSFIFANLKIASPAARNDIKRSVIARNRVTKQSYFKKIIAVCTAGCFIFTFIISQPLHAVIERQKEAKKFNSIFDEFGIPSSVGRITDSYLVSSEAYLETGKKQLRDTKYASRDTIFINIQDLHCHPEVQKNISKLLSLLDKKYNLEHVYMEGACGKIDTSWLANIKDKELRTKIVDTLIDGGKLSGAEHYSIVTGKTDLLIGADNDKLHKENVLRLKNISSDQESIGIIFDSLKPDLKELEERYYNAKNRKLSRIKERYQENKLKPEKYYELLIKQADKLDINVSNFRNISKFREVFEINNKLNFKSIGSELRGYLGLLKKELPYNTYNNLLEKTSNFTDQNQLYLYLIKIAEKNPSFLANFPNLKKFFNYLSISAQVNPLELIQEEERLITEIRLRLADTVTEKDAVFLVEFVKYLKDYLSYKVSADNYQYVCKNLVRFELLWSKYVGDGKLSELKPYIDSLNGYYCTNIKRNGCLINNCKIIDARSSMLDARNTSLASDSANIEHRESSIKNQKLTLQNSNEISDIISNAQEIVVLVTGGFHTQGISEILEERNISYIVITPNVTKDTKFAEAVYDELLEYRSKTLKAAAFSVTKEWGLPLHKNIAKEKGAVPILYGKHPKHIKQKVSVPNSLNVMVLSACGLVDQATLAMGDLIRHHGIEEINEAFRQICASDPETSVELVKTEKGYTLTIRYIDLDGRLVEATREYDEYGYLIKDAEVPSARPDVDSKNVEAKVRRYIDERGWQVEPEIQSDIAKGIKDRISKKERRPYSLIQNLIIALFGTVITGLVVNAVLPILTGAVSLSIPIVGLALVVLPFTLPVVIVLGGQLFATFITRVIASIVFRGIEMPDGTIDLRKDEPLRSATLQ